MNLPEGFWQARPMNSRQISRFAKMGRCVAMDIESESTPQALSAPDIAAYASEAVVASTKVHNRL